MSTDTYIANALRTKSELFTPLAATAIKPKSLFQSALYLKFWGGLVKKAIFYGKEVGPKEDEAIRCFTPPPIAALQWHKVDKDLVHGVLGLFTESCELMELLLQELQGEKVSRETWLGEIGDTQWYQAILLGHLGFTVEQSQNANIAKLKARFADKFTVEEVVNRDDTKENTALAAAI